MTAGYDHPFVQPWVAKPRWIRRGECPDGDCDGFFHKAFRSCCGYDSVHDGCSSICRHCPGCVARHDDV